VRRTALLTAQRLTNCYDLMDTAYDSHDIRQHSRKLGHVPIIEPQKRGSRTGNGTISRFVPANARHRACHLPLKDEFGGPLCAGARLRQGRAYLMFGILALTADQILRLAVPRSKPLPCHDRPDNPLPATRPLQPVSLLAGEREFPSILYGPCRCSLMLRSTPALSPAPALREHFFASPLVSPPRVHRSIQSCILNIIW